VPEDQKKKQVRGVLLNGGGRHVSPFNGMPGSKRKVHGKPLETAKPGRRKERIFGKKKSAGDVSTTPPGRTLAGRMEAPSWGTLLFTCPEKKGKAIF